MKQIVYIQNQWGALQLVHVSSFHRQPCCVCKVCDVSDEPTLIRASWTRSSVNVARESGSFATLSSNGTWQALVDPQGRARGYLALMCEQVKFRPLASKSAIGPLLRGCCCGRKFMVSFTNLSACNRLLRTRACLWWFCCCGECTAARTCTIVTAKYLQNA